MATDPCSDDFVDIIEQTITSPRRVSVDGVDAQTRSAAEIISLLRYRDARCAEQSGVRGFAACRKQQLSPPNALGIHLGYNVTLRGS